jgi:hypothetical protein
MAAHTFTGRSWALLTSTAVVVAAVLMFLITGSPDSDPAVASTPPADVDKESKRLVDTEPKHKQSGRDRPDSREGERERKRDKRRPGVTKPSAYVAVFNNSGITGLAGETASDLSTAGWKVLGTDNWYGSIPATTVYYPAKLKRQAELLAEEIGAERVRPAVEPMLFDRLTLILTGDL